MSDISETSYGADFDMGLSALQSYLHSLPLLIAYILGYTLGQG